MIIGVSGFGYTGSGAVLDILKGVNNLKTIDSFEFSFVYLPDGLLDLKYHLCDCPIRFMSSDIAIKRFKSYMNGKAKETGKHKKTFLKLTNEYIDSLVQIQWRGYWTFDYYQSSSFFKRNIGFRLFHSRIFKWFPSISKKMKFLPPYRTMYLSIRPHLFLNHTINYLSNLIKLFFDEKKYDYVAINQLFPANNPYPCFDYIPNSKDIT